MLIEIPEAEARRLNAVADRDSRDSLIRVYRHQSDASAADVRLVAALYRLIGLPERASNLLAIADQFE